MHSNESGQGVMLERTNSARNVLERASDIVERVCVNDGQSALHTVRIGMPRYFLAFAKKLTIFETIY